jgi:hypothetical protein
MIRIYTKPCGVTLQKFVDLNILQILFLMQERVLICMRAVNPAPTDGRCITACCYSPSINSIISTTVCTKRAPKEGGGGRGAAAPNPQIEI